MRVLLLSPVIPAAPGGVASHVSNQMRALAAIGIQTDLLVPGVSPGEGLKFRVWGAIRKALNMFRNPYGTLLDDYRRSKDIRKYFGTQTLDYDIVHCHSHFTDVVKELLSESKIALPVVLTVHGYVAYEAVSRQTFLRGSPGYHRLLNHERRVFSAADRVICVDSRLKDHVSGLAPDARTEVIWNAVDTSIYRPSDAREEGIILCPRALNPKNGVGVIIKATEIMVHRMGLDVHLVIAGDGRQKRELKNQVESLCLLDHVTFMGDVAHDEMPRLMARASLVVIPSIPVEGVEEATSIAAMEALACGVPLVASRIGGLKEIIRDGETGFLVEPNQPEELAEYCVKALTGSLSGELARMDAEQRYSLGRLASSLHEVYSSLVSNQGV